MSDLVAFLRARLAEDEAAARASDWGEPWSEHRWTFTTGRDRASLDLNTRVARHIVRWDPPRVLADVAAKRAVLALWEHEDGRRAECAEFSDRAELMDDVLLALAQPYAGHPEFDPAWRLA